MSFFKRGGHLTVKVTGKEVNLGHGNGLEIPALYTFTGNKKDLDIFPKLLKH